MGQSTDAIVCYGVRFADDFMEDTYTPPGPDEWKGAPDHWVWDEEEEEWLYAEGHKYAGEKVEDVFEELTLEGVEIFSHCSSEYPQWIACLEGTKQVANRGYPQKLDLSFGVPHGAADKLKKWAEKWQIPVEAEPAWWLCSDWS